MWTQQSWLAVLIFSATYLLICFQNIPRLRIDRPGAGLVGAVLMVAMGVLSFDQAWKAVDSHTIVLLLGMMILNVFLDLSGFFDTVAGFILRRARTPARLLAGLCVVSGVLSALFLNDTVCLMLTPPLLIVLRRAELSATPFLIGLAMSANAGSVMTVTGNPQNMLIGQFSGVSYLEFLAWLLPVGVTSLMILIILIRRHYSVELRRGMVMVDGASTDDGVKNPILLRKTLIILGLVLVGFVVMRDLSVVAIAGAAVLILWSGIPASSVLARVDWVLLLFFASLFIVVEGIEQTGVVEAIAQGIRLLQGPTIWTQVPCLSLITVAASNVVSNVPFVILARDIVPEFQEPRLMWFTLAMASTLAGNLTIPGSVATLIVLEAAKQHTTVGFFEFLRIGFKVTLLTVVCGVLLLIGEHLLLGLIGSR